MNEKLSFRQQASVAAAFLVLALLGALIFRSAGAPVVPIQPSAPPMLHAAMYAPTATTAPTPTPTVVPTSAPAHREVSAPTPTTAPSPTATANPTPTTAPTPTPSPTPTTLPTPTPTPGWQTVATFSAPAGGSPGVVGTFVASNAVQVLWTCTPPSTGIAVYGFGFNTPSPGAGGFGFGAECTATNNSGSQVDCPPSDGSVCTTTRTYTVSTINQTAYPMAAWTLTIQVWS